MSVCAYCQSQVNGNTTNCPHCGASFDVAPKVSIVRPAPRPKDPAEVQLGVTVDRTGSSQQFAEGIRKAFPVITSQVEAKVRKLTVWLQSHGDEDYGQDPVLLTNGDTAELALKDLQQIEFNGGGDAEEHHLSAIEDLSNSIPWTNDARRARGALLAFMTADSKPTRSGHTARELGEMLRQRGILLYLICEPATQLQELCSAAGGMMFPISNDPDPAEMQSIATQLSASIVKTVVTGGTVPVAV